MPTSLSNIKVTDGQNNLVITGNDITINGTSILGQNNYVTLDTTQTISGVKTFSNTIKSTRQGDGIFLTRKSSTDSTGDAFVDLKFFDTLGNRKGGVRNILENGNTTCLYVTNEAGTAIKNTLNVVYNESSDSVYTRIINPEINSLKLRTTQYDWGTNPTTGTDLLVHTFKDNTDTPVVSNRPYLSSNGSRYYFISVINKEKTKYTELAVGWDASGNATAIAPTPTSTTSTSSNQIATTGWVNTVGNNVVHLTGNETITGTKTFSSDILVKSTLPHIFCDKSDTTWTENPSTSSSGGQFEVRDKNGVWGVIFGTEKYTDGRRVAKMQVKSADLSTHGRIHIGIDVNNVVYTEAPTPVVSSNDRNIATTAYCNSKHQVVSALPASPNADVFYYIPA